MFMVDGLKFLVKSGIPSGAKFRGYGHDHSRNCIYVFVEHESFDEVREGEIYPDACPIILEELPIEGEK